MVVRRDEKGYASPALKIRQKGEVVKFEDIKEYLPSASHNKAMFQLLSDIKSYIQNNTRPLKLRKRLISELNAVLVQQQHN